MKHTLTYNDKPEIRCVICSNVWDVQEIAKKADMTADEICFFEFKMSLNFIYHGSVESSTCPSCGSFCQRQLLSRLQTKCIVCTKKNKKVYSFCWGCKSEWTLDHNCKDRLKVIQEILDKACLIELKYCNINGVPSIRACPGCTILIEIDYRSKTMDCRKCKTLFCFSCLKVAINRQLQCGYYNTKCNVAPIQKIL